MCACVGGQRSYSYFETHDVLPAESSVLWVMHCSSGANCAGQLCKGAALRPQFPPRRRLLRAAGASASRRGGCVSYIPVIEAGPV